VRVLFFDQDEAVSDFSDESEKVGLVHPN